jgi:hypothetical protein
MIKYQNLVTNCRAAKLKVSTPLITKFETCYNREGAYIPISHISETYHKVPILSAIRCSIGDFLTGFRAEIVYVLLSSHSD